MTIDTYNIDIQINKTFETFRIISNCLNGSYKIISLLKWLGVDG